MAALGGDYINGTDPYATPGGDDVYLSSLLSYSVSQLNKEPANLLEARTRAAAARKETAQKRYASFIAASELFAIVRREVADVEKGLDDLRSSLPALRNGCQVRHAFLGFPHPAGTAFQAPFVTSTAVITRKRNTYSTKALFYRSW